MFVDQNRRHYETGVVAARYATRSGLHPAEYAILERYRQDIAGRRILDLGVGGGRTTPYLLELSSNYIGVDYSREMIERCRGRFPGVGFDVVDARDLSRYSDSTFDFALFSHCGIDAIEHAGRIEALGEVHRVLSPGALFAFSTHNRNYRIRRPWDLSHFSGSLRDPIRFGKRVASYPMGIVNYLRRAHETEERDEYCMSVDSAYQFSLIHYRIDPAAQKKQLEQVGFCDIAIVDVGGRPLSLPEAQRSIGDPWLHYLCRRKTERRQRD